MKIYIIIISSLFFQLSLFCQKKEFKGKIIVQQISLQNNLFDTTIVDNSDIKILGQTVKNDTFSIGKVNADGSFKVKIDTSKYEFILFKLSKNKSELMIVAESINFDNDTLIYLYDYTFDPVRLMDNRLEGPINRITIISDSNSIKIGRDYIFEPISGLLYDPYVDNKSYRTTEIVNLNGKTLFFEVDKLPNYEKEPETFSIKGEVNYELIYHLPNKKDTSCVIADDVNIYLNHSENNILKFKTKTDSLGRYSVFVDSNQYDQIIFIGSDGAKTTINIKDLHPISLIIPNLNTPLFKDIYDPLSKDSILLKKALNLDSLMKVNPQELKIRIRGAKPAIYLYPTQTDTISIKLDFRGTLGTTYPKYTGEWKVLATPNGELTNLSDNRKYNYLFWEGIYNFPVSHFDYKSGFVVAKNDLDKFLIEKLSLIGLNNTEVNDFVVYWLPMLEKNEYNLIHFFINDNIDGSAFLNVKPKPDSEIRIFMEFKAVDKNYTITPQQLPSTSRKGFTLVEWGGGIIGDGKIQ